MVLDAAAQEKFQKKLKAEFALIIEAHRVIKESGIEATFSKQIEDFRRELEKKYEHERQSDLDLIAVGDNVFSGMNMRDKAEVPSSAYARELWRISDAIRNAGYNARQTQTIERGAEGTFKALIFAIEDSNIKMGQEFSRYDVAVKIAEMVQENLLQDIARISRKKENTSPALVSSITKGMLKKHSRYGVEQGEGIVS